MYWLIQGKTLHSLHTQGYIPAESYVNLTLLYSIAKETYGYFT